MMLDRAALEHLDRAALITLVLRRQARSSALGTPVTALAARVEELSGDPPTPPSAPAPPAVVKPARPPTLAKPVHKPRQASCARRREVPTRTVEHALAICPDCGTVRHGGEVVRRRQVLHVTPVPVEVIEHVVRRRVCPCCHRAHTPPLDLKDQVLGHHRVSLDAMALIATLHTVGRRPVRVRQWVLAALHGLRLRVGALVGILRAVADHAKPALDALRAQVRFRPVVCADETGWREDGTTGYVWAFTTPAHCYSHDDHRRAGAVITDVLGAVYEGTLVSDFSAAYKIHPGPHRRCWSHLLRDMHDVRVAHPDNAEVAAWADAVYTLYLAARQLAASDATCPTRRAARDEVERWLTALCAPYWPPGSTAPQATRCQRIDRFLDELFEFVLDPASPADNDLAERRLRPLVIARKISGGTRSAAGSRVRTARASLFATWHAQHREPFQACVDLLRHPAPTI